MTPSRRRTKTRGQRRSISKWLIRGLYVSAVVVLGAAALASPLASVRKVRLIVTDRLEEPELRCTVRRAQVHPGLPLMRFDRARYCQGLAQLPWVRSARAETRLTGDLVVSVIVRRPAAVVLCGGRRWEVDDDGIVIRPARKGTDLIEAAMGAPASLRPGEAIPCEMTVGALAALVLAQDVSGPKPERIAVDQNYGICFNNADKVAVCFGRPVDLPYKVALMDRIYRMSHSLSGRIEAIDLSCPQSPACKRRASIRRAPAGADTG